LERIIRTIFCWSLRKQASVFYQYSMRSAHSLVVVDIAINTGNFSNATWNAEMRALYDEERQGSAIHSRSSIRSLTSARAIHYSWREFLCFPPPQLFHQQYQRPYLASICTNTSPISTSRYPE